MRYNQPALVSLHKDIMDIRARAAEPVEIEHRAAALRERLELIDVHYLLSAGRAARRCRGSASASRRGPPSASSAAPAPARPPRST